MSVLDGPVQLNGALEAILPRRVSLITHQGQQAARMLVMQRDIGGKQAYFIVNNDRQNEYELDLALEGGANGQGRLEEWDPLTGEVRALPAVERGGLLHFQAAFGPAGSRLYVIDPLGVPVKEPGEAVLQKVALRHRLEDSAQFIGPASGFTRTDPNVLTLDMCQYRMGDGAWSAESEVWRAQDALREQLGMRPNYYNGLPQRYRWALAAHPNDGARVELRFTFQVRDVPAEPVPCWWRAPSASRSS